MSAALQTQQSGFTLMEMMVALLISTISLLGLAALQGTARTYIEITRQYTAANHLAQELIENMRANPLGMQDGHYNNLDTTRISATSDTSYCASGCSPANLAHHDAIRWSEEVTNQQLLRQGRGTTRVDAGRIIVTIMWSGDLTRINTQGGENLDCSVLQCLTQELALP